MYGPALDCNSKVGWRTVRENVSGLSVEQAPGHNENPRVPVLKSCSVLDGPLFLRQASGTPLYCSVIFVC